ncbi:hypothetical protein [Bacillus sp. 1P06AnD]|uniref:hypothetical protein n=1 Tax=Bacillus sp. 1P06AnD TaxID=3132208 RepID=UPI0039A1B28E
MKTIVATDLHIQETLPVRTVMAIYKEIKQWGGDVYLVQNRRMVSGNSLTKLLTFLMTTNSNTPIKLIVEGSNAQHMNQQLKDLFEKKGKTLEASTHLELVQQ